MFLSPHSFISSKRAGESVSATWCWTQQVRIREIVLGELRDPCYLNISDHVEQNHDVALDTGNFLHRYPLYLLER